MTYINKPKLKIFSFANNYSFFDYYAFTHQIFFSELPMSVPELSEHLESPYLLPHDEIGGDLRPLLNDGSLKSRILADFDKYGWAFFTFFYTKRNIF